MPGRSIRFAAGYHFDHVTGIAPAAAYGLGLVSDLLLFASILAHELSHAVVARRHGIAVEEIDLWLLGGVAKLQGQPRHPDEPTDVAVLLQRPA